MAGSDRPRPFGLQAPLGAWRALDLWFAAYAGLSVLLLAWGWARGQRALGWPALLDLGLLAAAALIRRISRDPRTRLPALLRLAYVPATYLVFYRQVQALWPLFRPAPLDALLVRGDQALFGFQPSLAFQAAFPQRGLSELFCFAYYAYYFFVPAVALTALLRRGYAAAERVLLATTGTFFACYAFFWLAPTVGPHFWFPPHLGPQPYRGYLFNHLLYAFTGRGEIRGGAFPSSHVAVALLLVLHARREAPRLWLPLAAITALMVPGVVYLRAHYAVDVAAGLAVGLLAAALTGALRSPRDPGDPHP